MFVTIIYKTRRLKFRKDFYIMTDTCSNVVLVYQYTLGGLKHKIYDFYSSSLSSWIFFLAFLGFSSSTFFDFLTGLTSSSSSDSDSSLTGFFFFFSTTGSSTSSTTFLDFLGLTSWGSSSSVGLTRGALLSRLLFSSETKYCNQAAGVSGVGFPCLSSFPD